MDPGWIGRWTQIRWGGEPRLDGELSPDLVGRWPQVWWDR